MCTGGRRETDGTGILHALRWDGDFAYAKSMDGNPRVKYHAFPSIL